MAGPVFAADPPELRRTLELDGLTAVFHRRSGITHILAPPAPQILEVLADGPAESAEILARMRARFELEATDVDESIAARLGELEAAGLVWRE